MAVEPKYIQDRPKGEDAFEGKSHETLAGVIGQYMVDTDKAEFGEPHSRIIGIEGTWGSGKTNIVKILKKELHRINKFREYHFYTFDAWANQEDIRRRSFLEQLTSDLVDNEILTGKTKVEIRNGKTVERVWDEALQIHLAHNRQSFIEKFPVVNGAIISIGIMALLTGILNLIPKSNLNSWINALINCSPLVVPIIVWLIMSLVDRKYFSPAYFFGIMTNRIQSEYSFEMVSEREPSIVDFRKWIQKISDSLCSEKKIVIVFDNMDRLPAEKVRVMWSLIHTFFAESESDGEFSFKNIWVIITYDMEHLALAYDDDFKTDSSYTVNDAHDEKETGDKRDENNIKKVDGFDDDAKYKVTQYFIDKTCSVTYRVPKPVITDYEGVFRSFYEQAFGKGNDVEIEEEQTVNRLYRMKRPEANVREIIIFINSLVTLCKTNGDECRRVSMAVYLLNRRVIEQDPVEHILSGDYLGEAGKIIKNDDDLQADVSALVYNIKRAWAEQIPLFGYLKRCVANHKAYDINKYSVSNTNFHRILSEVIAKEDIAGYHNIVDALLDLNDGHDMSPIWEDLADRWLKDKDVNDRLSVSEQFLKLLSNVSAAAQQKLVDKWYNHIFGTADFNGAAYVTSIKKIRRVCADGVTVPIKRKEVNAFQFVNALIVAQESYKEYKLTAAPDEVDTCITNDLLLRDNQCYKIVSILKEDNYSEFNNVKFSVGEMIKDPGRVHLGNVGDILRVYRLLSTPDPKDKPALDEATTFSLIKLLGDRGRKTEEDGYIDLLAMALAQIGEETSLEITENQRDRMVQIYEYYINAEDLLLRAVEVKNRGLRDFAKYVIISKCGHFVNPQKIEPIKQKIMAACDVSEAELSSYLDFVYADPKKPEEISPDTQNGTQSILDSFPDNWTKA